MPDRIWDLSQQPPDARMEQLHGPRTVPMNSCAGQRLDLSQMQRRPNSSSKLSQPAGSARGGETHLLVVLNRSTAKPITIATHIGPSSAGW